MTPIVQRDWAYLLVYKKKPGICRAFFGTNIYQSPSIAVAMRAMAC